VSKIFVVVLIRVINYHDDIVRYCRSSTFDPFLDISIPIPKGVDSKALLGRRLSKDRRSCTLEDCLGKFIGTFFYEMIYIYIHIVSHGDKNSSFDKYHCIYMNGMCNLCSCLMFFVIILIVVGEEILEGENMVTCDVCKEKRKSVKRISIYRYPRVLVCKACSMGDRLCDICELDYYIFFLIFLFLLL